MIRCNVDNGKQPVVLAGCRIESWFPGQRYLVGGMWVGVTESMIVVLVIVVGWAER